MQTSVFTFKATISSVLVALCLVAIDVRAGEEVLELFVGEWDVSLKVTYPREFEAAYHEWYEWTLDGRFVRGETDRLPDGTLAVIYGTYDAKSDRYPFWWFMSAGEACLWAEGKWDERTRTMVWKSPPFLDKRTELWVTFPDARTRKWTSVTRDLGGVLLRHEGIAVRRSNRNTAAYAVPPPAAASNSPLFDTASAGRGGISELTPQMLGSLLLLASIVVPVLALVVSALLLWLYRRSVDRQMLGRVGFDESPLTAEASRGEGVDRKKRTGEALYRRALRGPRWEAMRYVAAGLGLALAFALAARFVYPLRLDFHGFLIGVAIYAWPIVAALILIVPSSWRLRSGFVGAYFSVFVLLIWWAGPGEGLQASRMDILVSEEQSRPLLLGTLWLWLIVNGVPTLAVLLCFNRWARPVAPLVLGFVAMAICGIFAAYLGLFSQYGIEAVVELATSLKMHPGWLVAIAVIFSLGTFVAVGWVLARWISRSYRQGNASDRSLALDALWLLFATYYAMWLTFGGLGWAAMAPVGFALYKLILMLTRAATVRPFDSPRNLTFLRVFSLGRRSEKLLDRLASYWRHIGNVQMITGPDVARSTVHPHQFLDFLSGRLATHFVRNAASIRRSLAEWKHSADLDGRFSISNFFCYADSWQRLLPQLLQEDDVVLMDLRSFTAEDAGCIHELRYLVEAVPIEHCLLIVDHTTDRTFLDELLRETWESLSPDSPNRSLSPGETPIHRYEAEPGAVQQLVGKLCRAGAAVSTA